MFYSYYDFYYSTISTNILKEVKYLPNYRSWYNLYIAITYFFLRPDLVIKFIYTKRSLQNKSRYKSFEILIIIYILYIFWAEQEEGAQKY